MPQNTDNRPFDVLLIGHVTRDIIGTRSLLGGTVAFAAQAASCLGMRSAMVTSVPQNFGLLDPLRQDANIALHEVPAAKETTFHLTYSPAGRSMRVSHRAQTLALADVPQHLRCVPLAFVAPLLGECDREVVQGLSARVVLCTIQGWLRALRADGLVVPSLSDLVRQPPSNLNVVVFSELDHPQSEAIAQQLAGQGVLVALTRSTAGVSLYIPKQNRIDVPAAPALEVDPTGAGDVFGLVFGLALAHGLSAVQAAQQAVMAAARVVEGPGLGNLSAYVSHAREQHLGSRAKAERAILAS